MADGPHHIQASNDYGNTKCFLKIDGQLVASKNNYWNAAPKFNGVEWNGRVISVQGKGIWPLLYVALIVDGNEFSDAMEHPSPVFKQEVDVVVAEQLVSVEEYPLHNTYGDVTFTIDRQISKSSTNEISIEVVSQQNHKINTEVFTALKVEMASQLATTLGCKVDETVTETQTLHLSAGAHASVLYRVLWKRKVRAGKRVYTIGDEQIEVPYRLYYGLSCEIRSEELQPQGG